MTQSNRPLLGVKAAILVANGFCEDHLVNIQKSLQNLGANVRIISSEQGLVCGWTETGWGYHFAVDSGLNTVLAADYALLVVPGGQRSIDKLNLTQHTRRFINGFLAAQKPVAVFDEAGQLVSDISVSVANDHQPSGHKLMVVDSAGTQDWDQKVTDFLITAVDAVEDSGVQAA